MIEKLSELNLTAEEIGRVYGQRYSLIKKAEVSVNLKSHILKNLMGIGLSSLAGLGIAGVGYLSNKKKQDQQNEDLKKSFSTVIKGIASEPLRNNASDRWLAPVQAKLHSDPVYYHAMAKDAFNVLASAAPDMALHPIVAKNFLVTTLYNEGEIPEQKLNTISQISNNSFRNKKPNSLNLDSFGSVFSSSGGTKSLEQLSLGIRESVIGGKEKNVK